MLSYVHSQQTCLLKTVFSLIYFSAHTVWARCRKLLKTLLVINESIHEFGLMCMFVIAFFQCTLNSYFLLVVLLVMLISRKFSECLWSSNSTVYFIAGSCLFPKTYMHETSLENVRDCDLQNVWTFWGQFCNLRLPVLPLHTIFCK